MNQFYKNLALWLVVGLVVIALYNMFNQSPAPGTDLPFTEFIDAVEGGQVGEVALQGERILGKYKDGKPFTVYAMDYPDLFSTLRKNGVQVSVRPEEKTWALSIFITWFPMLLLVAIWFFFMRQMQNGGSRALSFGKSKARVVSDTQNKATFKDVAGVDEAKEDLQEIIDFLKDPRKFQKLGGKIPKGVLLMGPPGTGKTLLARAIAGEAGVPFFSISGSDFVEMFVGVGASRVRDLFEQAKKSSPCIIFIDEIDAVGRHRGAGLGGGHDEREQTLNQLLVEMDGFEANTATIIIAATNRPDVLDPALLRPGRFDRQVVVPRPDIGGREAILRVHVSNLPLDADVDVRTLARGTPGFTGADLANLCNEAALMAAREDAEVVHMRNFELAKDKVMMGAERRSMIISEKEKKATAVHEAGHALVALLLPGTDPIHKVSIIPRGRALGVTQQLPVDEKHTHPRDYLLTRLAIMMGGRAAEDLVLNQFTTGASNDIEQATALARKMVCEWGMSEHLGPVAFGSKEEQIFLGREIQQHRDFSEHTAIEIDKEIRKMLVESYGIAKGLMTDHRDILDAMTEQLLDVEVVDGHEIAELTIRMLEAKGVTPPDNASYHQVIEARDKGDAKKGASSSGAPTGAAPGPVPPIV
ncbi:MAG: ATP-dependent zinc metalloprotease FtsH [Nitrospinae bacterium]|nr:ATP-dependent zinc metalloprotease FtsH [Nitrospinota bacterium]